MSVLLAFACFFALTDPFIDLFFGTFAVSEALKSLI